MDDRARSFMDRARSFMDDNNPVHQRERNVLDHLPERDRPPIKRRLRAAWTLDDHAAALERLRGPGHRA
jgi:hypothetical protein